MRTGARTLGLLAVSLNSLVLRSLSTGPKMLADLRRESGSPAQSTLRSHLKALEALGVIVKHRRNSFPGPLEYELTRAGDQLRCVIAALGSWLAAAPDGPLELGGGPARAAIKALAEAWSSTMLRGLAARPLSLTELDSLIGSLNYPSLERRLGALRHSGMVQAARRDGKSTPYTVTGWLRRGIGPLGAASRWERCHLPDSTAPIGRLDAETALLLAIPLLDPPADLAGSCRLVVELTRGSHPKLATVTAGAKGGVVSCVARSDPADAWATGSPSAWFSAAAEADFENLELGGDGSLARALLEALYGALRSERTPESAQPFGGTA